MTSAVVEKLQQSKGLVFSDLIVQVVGVHFLTGSVTCPVLFSISDLSHEFEKMYKNCGWCSAERGFEQTLKYSR